MTRLLTARPLTYGDGAGEVLHLAEPVSFWAGVNHQGIVADRDHPQHGQCVSGKVLVMTSGRGSSTGAFGLMELMRTGLAPAAIVLCEPDGVICTGVLVGMEIYDLDLPVVQIDNAQIGEFVTGQTATVSSAPGRAEITL